MGWMLHAQCQDGHKSVKSGQIWSMAHCRKWFSLPVQISWRCFLVLQWQLQLSHPLSCHRRENQSSNQLWLGHAGLGNSPNPLQGFPLDDSLRSTVLKVWASCCHAFVTHCVFGPSHWCHLVSLANTLHLARRSFEVWPWCASCRWLRVPGVMLLGMTTLLPFMTIVSGIANSSRKHQYRWRYSSRSCMLFGQPVMIRSVSVARVQSAFVTSCQDSRRLGSTFRTCAMLISKPEISLALPGWMRRERVWASNTLLDSTYFTWMLRLERRSSILCSLTRAKLIGFWKGDCKGLWSVCTVIFCPNLYLCSFLQANRTANSSRSILE